MAKDEQLDVQEDIGNRINTRMRCCQTSNYVSSTGQVNRSGAWVAALQRKISFRRLGASVRVQRWVVQRTGLQAIHLFSWRWLCPARSVTWLLKSIYAQYVQNLEAEERGKNETWVIAFTFYKELSSSIFQSLSVSESGIGNTCPDLHFVQYIKAKCPLLTQYHQLPTATAS